VKDAIAGFQGFSMVAIEGQMFIKDDAKIFLLTNPADSTIVGVKDDIVKRNFFD
jgi:hypothetical protein